MQDYLRLGLRCGIEIHQQLNTHKLFCECPSVIREDEPDGRVIRKLRAVAGELGEVDPAALHEFLRDREFVYEYYKDTTCLVELDEEPPHEINREALNIAIMVSKMLNARVVDKIEVMRKTVIDGSNTSGFQRTMLVATDGYIEVDGKRIGIPTICLEEDAARIIEKGAKRVVYRLDRLGIPLIEIGTSADISSPQEARKVAEKIGMLLRATHKVKRGLGTIRQDLNVSIKGGERIEIKGVQNLNHIAGLVENEARRQAALLEIRDELKRRRAKRGTARVVDLSKIFKGSKSKVVADKKVFGTKIEHFSGIFGRELMPGYRFGTELATIAMEMEGVGGILHSDELPGYGITEAEVMEVSRYLGVKEGDGFVMVVCDRGKAERVLSKVMDRCNAALRGVPKEVRRADGVITRFMRPLPGSARMYPETDVPAIKIEREMLMIKLPETPEEEMKKLQKLGLSRELANQIIRAELVDKFVELVKKMRVKPSIIASTILTAPKEVDVEEALDMVDQGRLAKESIGDLIEGMKDGMSAEEVAKKRGLFLMKEAEVRRIVADVVKRQKNRTAREIMGVAMSKLRGRADAGLVWRLVEELKGGDKDGD